MLVRISVLCALFFTFAVVSACSSTAQLGESCASEGATDVCVDGAICAKGRSDALQCLKICTSQADCGSNSNCNGTSKGSTKACRSNL